MVQLDETALHFQSDGTQYSTQSTGLYEHMIYNSHQCYPVLLEIQYNCTMYHSLFGQLIIAWLERKQQRTADAATIALHQSIFYELTRLPVRITILAHTCVQIGNDFDICHGRQKLQVH